MKYSVVAPIYNEQEMMEKLYRRLSEVMKNLNDDYEIVFIDDGSTDLSFTALRNIADIDKRVKVISFTRNYGQHPAVIAGFDQAEGDLVITLDGDLQNPPEEIPKLVNAINRGYDMASGIRKFRKDSLFRRLSSLMTTRLLNMISGSNINDYGTMLRVFKRGLVKEMVKRYAKERLYIPVLVNKITKNIIEVEVNHDSRFLGSSKYSFVKLFKTFFLILLRYNTAFASFLRLSGLLKERREVYNIKTKINCN